jgi:arabinofuranan 3-O-arabinosyltransferase
MAQTSRSVATSSSLAQPSDTLDSILIWSGWSCVIVIALAEAIVAIRARSQDDFDVYWRAMQMARSGLSPYAVHAGSHFIYPPGALFLLAPTLWPPLPTARVVMVVASAIAIVGGLVVTTWCLGSCASTSRLRSRLALLSVFAVASAPAIATLHLGNANGLLFFLFAVFTALYVRRHAAAAGAALGVTLALKPLAAPVLLILALLRGRGRAALTASIALVFIISAIGALVLPDPLGYWTVAVPWQIWDSERAQSVINISLVGAGHMLGAPAAAVVLAQITTAAAGVLAVVLRLRVRSVESPLIIDLAGIVLMVAFLDFTQTLHMYDLWLAPFLMATALPDAMLSLTRIALPTYLIAGPDVLVWRHWNGITEMLATVRTTLGLVLLLALVVVTLVTRQLSAMGEMPSP